MNIKKEARLLLLMEFDNYIIAIVIRGFAGIEGVAFYNNCSELSEVLKRGKGLLAEVNYIVSEYDVCKNLELKHISIEDINDKDILKAVNEAANIFTKAKARYTVLKALSLNKVYTESN
jgi:hypothetical protein